MATPRFFTPSVFFSNAIPLRVLPNPLRTSPRPSKGDARVSNASAIFLTMYRRPKLAPTANTLPHSIFPRISIMRLAMELKSSYAIPAAALTPFTKPCTTFFPISYISVDGECIPRTSLTVVRIFSAKPLRNSITPAVPF